MPVITAVRGDLTRAKVHAIVNAANEVMLGGGGVDGAIHRAAGPALLEACKAVPAVNGIRCPTGEARITSAGNLPARYVIHTVGPVYSQVNKPVRPKNITNIIYASNESKKEFNSRLAIVHIRFIVF